MTSTYLRHIPSPPLSEYVDYLYYHDGRIYPREKMLPMTTVHLIVSFGGVIRIFDAARTKLCASLTESWVIGPWSICHIADWPSHVQFFGVCFKPGGAYPFLRLPLHKLHNRFVPLDAIWGHAAGDVREQLYAAPTIQAGFDLLERLLLACLADGCHGSNGHMAVRYCVAEIARQHGALSIRALSEGSGISQNHLLTQFKRMVGLAPKELACLSRLRHALYTTEIIDLAQRVDWARIAKQTGYYDQAHLHKDFMAHLGLNPTDYMQLRRRAQAENPERYRDLRRLPVD